MAGKSSAEQGEQFRVTRGTFPRNKGNNSAFPLGSQVSEAVCQRGYKSNRSDRPNASPVGSTGGASSGGRTRVTRLPPSPHPHGLSQGSWLGAGPGFPAWTTFAGADPVQWHLVTRGGNIPLPLGQWEWGPPGGWGPVGTGKGGKGGRGGPVWRHQGRRSARYGPPQRG
jgi:hypothetical protein